MIEGMRLPDELEAFAAAIDAEATRQAMAGIDCVWLTPEQVEVITIYLRDAAKAIDMLMMEVYG